MFGSLERTRHLGPPEPGTSGVEKNKHTLLRCHSEHSLRRRKIQRWVHSQIVSSWGGGKHQLLKSFTVPTLLWCSGLGWAWKDGCLCVWVCVSLRRAQTCWVRWPAPGLLVPAGWAGQGAPFPRARSLALPIRSCLPRWDTASFTQNTHTKHITQMEWGEKKKTDAKGHVGDKGKKWQRPMQLKDSQQRSAHVFLLNRH